MSQLLAELARGSGPSWASGYGEDEYGPFLEFMIESVAITAAQRLRWIPPGAFIMGSPESEVGRYDDEGPQHEVRLSRGFWLFDAPCRQSLYEALTGENPSCFRDQDRPVETVTWNDATAFCRKLEGVLVGSTVRLPTDAEWEYACRAGTVTQVYSGDCSNVGVCNAPALDPIAWYGGNSGLDFDLPNGVDSSDWPEMQYPHSKAGTRKVGRKAPNSWGLFDMLGNVWEWCLDGRRVYSTEAEADPLGPTKADAPRVLRGGSWLNAAMLVRSAYRDANVPASRNNNVGFRCVVVQNGCGVFER